MASRSITGPGFGWGLCLDAFLGGTGGTGGSARRKEQDEKEVRVA
jgi:hypothetical protein